jgi:hypothetical protein
MNAILGAECDLLIQNPLAPGSYTQVRIAQMVETCASLELTYSYGIRADFIALAQQTAVPQLNADQIQVIMSQSRTVKFVYKTSNQATLHLAGTEIRYAPPTDHTVCESVNFFGVPLNCFNPMGTKPDNLRAAIVPLAFLKRTDGVPVWNPIAKLTLHPFQMIIDRKVEFVDATDYASPLPAATPQFGDVSTCGTPTGPAAEFFSFHLVEDPRQTAPEPTEDFRGLYAQPLPSGLRLLAFVCNTHGQESASLRVEYAGIYYHEAVHSFGGHGHFGINPATQACDTSTAKFPGNMEWDLMSVYAAHIYYLYDESANPALTKDDRCLLYQRAEAERTANRLCPGASFGLRANPCL